MISSDPPTSSPSRLDGYTVSRRSNVKKWGRTHASAVNAATACCEKAVADTMLTCTESLMSLSLILRKGMLLHCPAG